jgi:hypothetical protein
MDFPLNTPGTVTDELFLYRSLGSFWIDVFEDKSTLKGYTKGQAEEISQRYLDLIEVINSYSSDKISVFHKEKWKPIHILKSKLNEAPFTFNPDDAVFGVQPDYSQFYAGQPFKFGNPKTPSAKVYQYYVGKDLVDFGIIADRVISPVRVYIYGSDVIISKGTLSFNKNVFDDPDLVKFDVFDNDGNSVTYTDINGVTQQEQSMTLWAYNGLSDTDKLYKAFGYIFRLYKPSSEFYKQVLAGVIKLFINGPTISIIKKIIRGIYRSSIYT